MFVKALADHTDHGTPVLSQSMYTQLGSQPSKKISSKIGILCVTIAEGSHTNFYTSKYVEEDIEVNELGEGNLSAAEGKQDKNPRAS